MEHNPAQIYETHLAPSMFRPLARVLIDQRAQAGRTYPRCGVWYGRCRKIDRAYSGDGMTQRTSIVALLTALAAMSVMLSQEAFRNPA